MKKIISKWLYHCVYIIGSGINRKELLGREDFLIGTGTKMCFFFGYEASELENSPVPSSYY